MQRIFIIVALGVLCVLAIATNHSSAGSIVVNGGFETGDFTGWTLVGDPTNNFVDTGFPHSGRFAAALGETGDIGSLSQTLVTNVGASYSLSFWFAGDGNTPSEFTASIGGAPLLDLVNPPANGYNQYTYNFNATSTSSILQFSFRDDVYFMNLDDVSVVPAVSGSVPEPMSLIPLGTGLVALGSYMWYRRRAGS